MVRRLTRRSSHFSSSVTHLVSPGASSTRNFSVDSSYTPSGYSSTLLPSVRSIKRAVMAGASSATREYVLSLIVDVWNVVLMGEALGAHEATVT